MFPSVQYVFATARIQEIKTNSMISLKNIRRSSWNYEFAMMETLNPFSPLNVYNWF